MNDRPRFLSVFYAGERVAEITERRGELRATYLTAAFDRWPLGSPVLSCSLPLRTGAVDATSFLDGLLPESPHRAELAARADVAASDTFGLLARYGREIAGALVIAGKGELPPHHGGVIDLDDDALAEEVAALPERPLGIHDDSELSLAGVQDKMLLVARDNGGWARPTGATPSTHILKLDHHRYPGLVAAEAVGLALARAAELSTIDAQLVTTGGIDCLIIERFDRVRHSDGTVTRLHQEDMCQATGRPAARKYEVRQGGGGPAFRDVAELLDRWSGDPLRELDRLAGVAAFTAVIGNADAHGKNLAVIHTDDMHVTLAPLYDQVPTALWPSLVTDAAMSIGGTVTLTAVDATAIAREARSWHHDPDRAVAAATAAIEAVVAAIDGGVIDTDSNVAKLVRRRAQTFLASA
ncbi:MAG: HipA domain-containing protein [Microthrixaceae bacterium]